ncbi:hypothetical protein JCM10207_008625 [Rhodosporidiobolus poonsookiae]
MAPLPLPPSPPLDHLLSEDLRALLQPFTLLPSQRIPLGFTNWATTFHSSPSAVFRPTEVDHVRWAVELARREGKELRAAGAGHSPSDIVCTEGFIIDLKGLRRVLDVDATAQTFHAEGGILLRDVHPVILEKGNLALSSLGSISDQTLAGAIATSTHGSGVSFPSLSTCATFLDVVLPLPGAPVVRCSRQPDEDPELFHAALCGIGAVGIVVGVGMRAEKAFKLEEECFSMELRAFRRNWREIAESAEHVRCWWFPQIGRVKVSRMNRTSKPVTRPPSALSLYITDHLLAKRFHAVVLTLCRVFPSLLPYHAWTMWTLVHQPGPIRWGAFLHGLLAPMWGAKGPYPRLEELEELEQLEKDEVVRAAKQGEAVEAPAAAAQEASAAPSKPSLAIPPADILSPPLTPPATTPHLSPSPRERTPSPLATGIALNLDELPEAAVAEEEKEEVFLAKAEQVYSKDLPWPILEDAPTYRVGHSVDIFNYDCGFPQYTYESCVPYSTTGSALTALHAWHTRALHEKAYPLRAHFPIEIRWTEEDEGWLSPTNGGRGTYLGAIQYRPFNLPIPYRSYFTRFSSLLTTSFLGRPHWAKSHHLAPSALRELYPRFDDFLAVRERVDPQGVLVNPYVRRHLLGLEEGEGTIEKDVRRFKARA